ncbi:MAG: KH domain-containing protein [Patescibacteria group bacterium]|jgi:hypothetical protein
MREFIEYLVKQMVSKEEAVEVTEDKQDTQVSIFIRVDPEDMGMVIGKEGKNIRGIRALAKAKAIKDNIRVNVELIEDKTTEKSDAPEI